MTSAGVLAEGEEDANVQVDIGGDDVEQDIQGTFGFHWCLLYVVFIVIYAHIFMFYWF